MPDKPLRTAFKDLLEQNTLSEDELERLQAIQTSGGQQNVATKRGAIFKYSLFAASLAVLIISFVFVNQSQTTQQIHQRIAAEVLTNHFRIKTLDIETSSINELKRYFTRLDFAPYLSSPLESKEYQLLGGRYCTLQGLIASQLRLRSASGDTLTYYQTHYKKEQFGSLPDISKGEQPKTIIQSGIEISIWIENSVVSVLAQNAYANHKPAL